MDALARVLDSVKDVAKDAPVNALLLVAFSVRRLVVDRVITTVRETVAPAAVPVMDGV